MASEDFDKYVVARFAEWAGDTVFALSLVKEFASEQDTKNGDFPLVEDAQEFVAFVARNEFEARLSNKSFSESADAKSQKLFEYQVKPYFPNDDENPDSPEEPIVETRSLRGVVHTVSEREFELRAFLKDLREEERIIANVNRLSGNRSLDEEETAQWVEEGELFLMVAIDELCLITARGIWTRRDLPNDPTPIFSSYRRLLEKIETGFSRDDSSHNSIESN